jgi:ParB-like chromosome segregation protein Spo0J
MRKLGISKTADQMAKEIGVAPSTMSNAMRLAVEAPRKFNAVAAGRMSMREAILALPLTERQKENRRKRTEYYRQGLTLSDTIRTTTHLVKSGPNFSGLGSGISLLIAPCLLQLDVSYAWRVAS